MSNNDSIIATRSRRANAGSRLKHLLELEELNNDMDSLGPMNDDDENVNLLFQEDEDDGEFIEEDEESDEGSEDGADDEGGDETKADMPDKTEEDGDEEEEDDAGEDIDSDQQQLLEDSRKRSLDEDEMLSDSELSSDDEDESEGEKELQKQERIKKRKVQRTSKLVNPKITTRPPKPKTNKLKHQIKSDSLMSDARRVSNRSTTIQNKLEVVERLKETEERKSKLKPVIRKEKIEMTQEERLQEALTTEKVNILSLNKFKEQEYVKKERQRALQLSKRVILVDIIRFNSVETYVTPLDEINEAKRLIEMTTKKKDRRGRKKKIRVEEPKLEINNEVGEVMEGSEVKLDVVNKVEILPRGDGSTSENATRDLAGESSQILENETEEGGTLEITPKTETENRSVNDSSNTGTEKAPETVNAVDSENIETNEIIGNHAEQVQDQETIDSMSQSESPTILKDENSSSNPSAIQDPQNSTEEHETILEPVKSNEEAAVQQIQDLENSSNAELNKKEEDSESEPNGKKVTFAIESSPETKGNVIAEEPTPGSNEATPSIEESVKEEQEVYEGPPQRVSKNSISFLRFSDDITIDRIKKKLLGPDSDLPASRRFKELVPVSRIKYEPTLQNNLFKPIAEIKADQFEKLELLPRFGDVETRIETVAKPTVVEEEAVQLKTEPPNGIYLPNGNKKHCFITGKQAVYFHPERGIPYSNVESNKLIEIVESGDIPWTFINDSGLFYGLRKGARHAKGVPEGFDGF